MIALVLVFGLIELAVWVALAQIVSGWWVFFWFIAAFFLGLKLLRHTSRILMPQLQQMQQGMMPQNHSGFKPELQSAVAQMLAAILLMIPGVISDVMALFLLLPFVQKRTVKYALQVFAKRQQAMMQRMMQQQGMNNPMFNDLFEQMKQQHRQNDSIIEGEAREILQDVKEISEPPKKS